MKERQKMPQENIHFRIGAVGCGTLINPASSPSTISQGSPLSCLGKISCICEGFEVVEGEC